MHTHIHTHIHTHTLNKHTHTKHTHTKHTHKHNKYTHTHTLNTPTHTLNTHTQTGRDHPLSGKSTLKNSHSHSKDELENRTFSHIRHAQQLQLQQDFLICPCDKNLGPAIIEHHNYSKIAMRNHLLDGCTYRPLSNTDYSKNELENRTSSHIRHVPCNNYNYNKISSFAPAIKT